MLSEVAIVGAGPVGIALALRLASFGISSVLMDSKPHQIKQGSKACLIQGDVLEVLDKFGCGEQIAYEGIAWRTGHTYIRNRKVLQTEYAERPGYSEFVNISQFRIEQIMLERLAKEPLCTMRWGHKVEEIENIEDGVHLTVKTGEGQRQMSFRYVIGCDGIHSSIRKLLGVRWTGYTHKDRFLITDIYVDLPLRKERHFHFDPDFNRGRQLVMHPQPGNMWRIDWQLSPDANIELEKETGALDKRIRAVIGEKLDYKIDWLSTYRFNQRIAENFRQGSVFLAGDSAHALPPYGSRGMNSGIQDADNIAWKLAAVLHGRASQKLLDSYHEERYQAACENLRVTEATIRFMVPPTPAHKVWRDFLLWASRRVPLARKFLNSGKMAKPFRYVHSPAIADSDGEILTGAFAPDVPVESSHGESRLRRYFGPNFTAIGFCRNAMDIARLSDCWQVFAASHDLRILALIPSGLELSDLPDGVAKAIYDPADANFYDRAKDKWILIRPDGHIASLGALGDVATARNRFLSASGYECGASLTCTMHRDEQNTQLTATAAE